MPAVSTQSTSAIIRAAVVGLVAALIITAGFAAVLAQPRAADAQSASPGLVIEGDIVSGNNISAREGSWRSYTVKLATQPSDDVRVDLSPHNDDWKPVHVQWEGGHSSATFTRSNWNTAKTVYIWGNHDNTRYIPGQGYKPFVGDEIAYVYHTAWSDYDDDYDTLRRVMNARAQDDDGMTLSTSSLTVTEGGSATYTVSLITQPYGPVTVSISADGDDDITFSPSSLTFNASNHSTEQTVTVSAAPDADTSNGTATITHNARGYGYDYHFARLSVTESDTGAASVTPTPVTPTGTPAPTVSLVIEASEGNKLNRVDLNGDPVPGVTVPRGGSSTFTVKLGKKPTANVPVSITKLSDSDNAFYRSPGWLTFTPDNWDTGQTVTVSSSDGVYGDNSGGTLYIRTGNSDDRAYDRLRASYYYMYEVDPDALYLSSRDIIRRDGAGSITVPEGDGVTYSFKLLTQPSADVIVTIAGGTDTEDDIDLTASPASYTFTPNNWNLYRRVRISAAHDADLVNGSRKFTHTATSTDANYNGKSETITATESEDDTPSLVLSTTALSVPEGETATYTVELSNQPSGVVTVNIARGTTGEDDSDITVSPASLTFGSATWNTGQTVTVRAAADGDDLHGRNDITHTAFGAEFQGLQSALTATERDDDKRGFIVHPAPGSVAMTEGGTHTYTISLGTEPTADVTVAIAKAAGGDADLTISPASLTFNANNYTLPQTVTISAAEDDTDYVDDTATFEHTVTTTDSIYAGESIGDINVTAKDNDAAIILSATSVQVRENSTATYTVRLTNAPTGDAVITIAEGAGDDSIRVSSPSNKQLTFNASNWNTPQTVRLRASSDSDAINGTRTINHTGSGAVEFVGITASITAVERDAGAQLNIRNALDTGSLTTLNVPENGSVNYTVKLPAQPSSNVTVTLAVTGDSNITLNSATLTFTKDNFSTAQNVIVSAAQDTDLANGTATIAHTASGGGYDDVTASLTAREVDNTGKVVLRNAADDANITTIRVPENGNVTYKVELSHQPLGSVTVRLSLESSSNGGDTDITASPTTLYFNANNWNTAKTVTLRARDDSDKQSGTREITHTATGGGYNSAISGLTATEAENDLAVILTPESAISVTEGSTATFTAALSTAPTADVTVTVAAATTGDNTDGSITASPASLTFTALNYSTAQTVTLTAAEDTDFEHGKRDFTLTANGGGYVNVAATITATAAENDYGIHVSPASLTVPETGSATYQVSLGAAPSANSTIRLYATGGDSDITYDTDPKQSGNQSALIFTTTNYSVPQTVTVRAASDADAIAGTKSISHSQESGPVEYVHQTTDITVTEGEPPVLIRNAADNADVTALDVPEGSTSGLNYATYKVKLSSQPSSTVTVYLDRQSTSGANAGDSNISRSPSSLRFTTQNWGTAQTVKVWASQDSDLLNGTRTISHRVNGGGYSNAGAGVLTATEVDDDTGEIVLTPANNVSVSEDGTGTYTVKLSKQPRASVTVTLAAGTTAPNNDTDITIQDTDDNTTGNQTTAITFTTSNWNTARTVTLAAADDDDNVVGRRDITHTAAGDDSGYASVTKTMTAVEAENDRGITLSTSALSVPEGSSATYTVALTVLPTSSVTVALTALSTDDSNITFNPSSLTFNANNWNTPKTVRVYASQDNGDVAAGTKTITHTANGGGYTNVIGTLTATEDDNDTGRIILRNAADTSNITGLDVPENGNASYSVKLSHQPGEDVIVTLSDTSSPAPHNDNNITITSPANSTLTFTADNWDTAQTVSLNTTDDTDAVQGTNDITHTANASGGYTTSVTASLRARELENDWSIKLTKDGSAITAVTVPEGGSLQYKVGVSHRPTGTVTVKLTAASGDSDITFSPSTLYFYNSSSWANTRTVTVRAAQDNTDVINGTKDITHTATGGSYDNVPTAKVKATESDNDTGSVLIRNSGDTSAITELDVPEGGTASYSVKLSHQPSANVTVTLSYVLLTNNDTDLTIKDTDDSQGGDQTTAITFTTINWNTARTVILAAAEDNNDTVNGQQAIGHLPSATGGYAATLVSMTAREVENDQGIQITPASLTVKEGGSATYKVGLSVRPTANVTVALTAASGDDNITFSPSSLTFYNNSNWANTRTVTVRASKDADTTAGTKTITHTATSGDLEYDDETATLTATEGEPDVLVRNAADSANITTLDVPEGSSSSSNFASYKVKLNSQPSGTVTVYLDLQSTSGANAGDSNIRRSPSSLTFTTQSWNTAKTVKVWATEDSDMVNGTRTITHRVSGGGYSSAGSIVLTATEAENDGGVVIRNSADTADITTLSVTEGGTATYKVELNIRPTSSVTVTISEGTGANDDTNITVTTPSNKTLTFTTNNWDTAQSVTLSASEDDTDLLNGSRVITHTTSSTDQNYASKSASLTATEADNDTGAVVIRNNADDANITTLGVPEGGTAQYKVELSKEPRANVTVTLAEATTGDNTDTDITISSPSGKTLTFTPNNWSTAQTVTLQAAQDSGQFFGSRDITHTASGADSGYAGARVVTLLAREQDDDARVSIHDGQHSDIGTLNVREGSTATYHVELSAVPISDVTVTLTATGDSDITFSPSTMTFTTTNYNTGQEVTISAAPDTDTLNGSKTITHTAMGGGYDHVPAETLSVAEQDGPTLAVVISAHNAAVTISQHTAAWWIKHTPSGACTSVPAGEDISRTGLTKNTDYTFTAYSDSTCSTALTPSVTKTTLNPELTTSGVTATTATLTLSGWVVTMDGQWRYKHVGGTCSDAQSALTANVTGLTHATYYTFTAYNDATCSAGEEIDAAPQFPTNTPDLASSNITQTGLTLTLSNWDVSKDGSWYYKQDTTCSAAQTSLTVNVTNLTAGTSYTFQGFIDSACTTGKHMTLIRTVSTLAQTNTNTSSEEPLVSQPVQQEEPAGEPPARISSVTATRGNGVINVTWPAAEGATKYEVQYTVNGWHWWTVATAHTTTNFTIYESFATRKYIVRVRAGNDYGWSWWRKAPEIPRLKGGGGGIALGSEPSNVIPTPDAPESVTLSWDGDALAVTWPEAANAVLYAVAYMPDGGAAWAPAHNGIDATTITINGLDIRSSYIVRVRSRGYSGVSDWTVSAPVAAQEVPPARISSVTATRGNGVINVTWPAAAGATKYEVQYTINGSHWWTVANAHTSTSFVINESFAHRKYIVRVRAGNDYGWSWWRKAPEIPKINNGGGVGGIQPGPSQPTTPPED